MTTGPVERVIAALEGRGSSARGDVARGWTVQCPAHNDRNASLSLGVGDDERALLHCHAGCTTEEIVAALGLELRDLFADDHRSGSNGHRKIAATYDYVDEHGELLYQVVRFEPKSFRQRRPDGNGWKWSLRGTRRVLYRLPQVLEAVAAGRWVWVVEGEKDAAALEQMGEVATCNAGGAGKWRKEYAEAFRGARVLVIADRDEPGRKHAQAVAASLEGIAAQVRVGEPAEGKDVHDHLAAGLGLGDFTPVSLPTPKSTEQTEHSGKSPANPAVSVFGGGANTPRTPTEHLDPPPLASKPEILACLDEKMDSVGLVGERQVARAVYLVHVSRLLPEPARVVVKGDSSTGKSYAVECALKAAAPEFVWARTSTSPLALFYSEDDFRHRTLVFYEANKLGDDDDQLARVLRTLLSEGNLRYEVTDPKTRTTVLLKQDGPVAFISTVARASLDKEIETRILSIHSDGSDEMTQNVVAALLNAAADSKPEPDFGEWHALDRWLASGSTEVVVPWGPTLAGFRISGPPRLRRDITNLLSLVKSHALLHRATREVDPRGRVIATLDDYEVVRELLADALAVATDKAVRSGTREIVEAVAALKSEGAQPISLRAASRKAKRSPSTTHTDAMDALEKGYLVNRSQKDRSYDLDVGEPLPTKEELLPSTEEIAEVFGRRSATVRCPTEHETPVTTGDWGECSVCSVDLEPDRETSPKRPVEGAESEQGAEVETTKADISDDNLELERSAADDDDFIERVLARHGGNES